MKTTNKSAAQVARDEFNQLQQLMSDLYDLEQQHEQKREQLKAQISLARSRVAMALGMLSP